MDDYIFEDFSDPEEGESDISYFRDAEHPNHGDPPFPLAKTQEMKNTAESESQATEELLKKQPETYTEGLFEYHKRERRIIEVCSQKTRKQYVQCKMGSSGDTSDLTINAKTIFRKLFEEANLMHELGPKELSQLLKFKNSTANIAAIRRLFGIEQCRQDGSTRVIELSKADSLRRIFLSKTSGFWLIEEVLRSHMGFSEKMVTLKYLEVLRKAGVAPWSFQNWKKDIQ